MRERLVVSLRLRNVITVGAFAFLIVIVFWMLILPYFGSRSLMQTDVGHARPENELPVETDEGSLLNLNREIRPHVNMTELKGVVLRSGKLTAEAIASLGLKDSQASRVNDLLAQGLEQVKAAEKEQAELVSDKDGVFFRLPPAIEGRLDILKGLRDSLNAVLGEERANSLADYLEIHMYFRPEPGFREVSFAESDDGIWFSEKRSKGSPKATEQTIGPMGMAKLGKRWGHLFDMARWQEHVDQVYEAKSQDGAGRGEAFFELQTTEQVASDSGEFKVIE